jgi:hypothetical protein
MEWTMSAGFHWMLPKGGEVCLRLCLVCRETREEARRAAEALIPEEEIGRQERRILARSDSQTLKDALAAADGRGWVDDRLWAGLVPYRREHQRPRRCRRSTRRPSNTRGERRRSTRPEQRLFVVRHSGLVLRVPVPVPGPGGRESEVGPVAA